MAFIRFGSEKGGESEGIDRWIDRERERPSAGPDTIENGTRGDFSSRKLPSVLCGISSRVFTYFISRGRVCVRFARAFSRQTGARGTFEFDLRLARCSYVLPRRSESRRSPLVFFLKNNMHGRESDTNFENAMGR